MGVNVLTNRAFDAVVFKGNPMRTLSLFVLLTVCSRADAVEFVEASSTGNLRALAGTWKPVEHFHHLLDSELVSRDEIGFEISIDDHLGDSHRKAKVSGKSRERYYPDYAAFLKEKGHEPIATGFVRFDDGAECEHVITKKAGSLYLWYGVVFINNPRIFIGRGADVNSAETVVVEWTSSCSDTPVKLERDFATIVYKRVDRDTAGLGNLGRSANKSQHGSDQPTKRDKAHTDLQERAH